MASDFKLVIKEIRGESQDKRLDDGIDINDWSIGASSSADLNTHQARSKVRFAELTVTKNADIATPALYDCLARNALLKEVKLVCRKSGVDGRKLDYLIIELRNARIRAVTTKVQQALGIAPIETVSIGYQKIAFTYQEQSKDATALGKGEFEYDLTAGQ